MRSVALCGIAVAACLAASVAACGGEEKPAQVPTTAQTPTAAPTTPPAPTAEAPKPEAPKESLAQLQEKTGKGMMDAMNSHDAKKLASFYSESAVVKIAGAPADATGRDAIAQSYEKLFQAFPDYKTGASRVFAKGEVLIVEWAFNGTHKGDLWGMKATEKPAGAMGVDILWFTPEGQIKEHHMYYDGGTILSQVGIVKMKARSIPTVPSSPQAFMSNGSPDEQKNVDVAKTMNTSIEAKKEADFLGIMDDKIEWDDMSAPTTSKGKGEAKKFMKEITTGFPDYKASTTNTWTFGDYVITEGSWTGTHKGTFFGMQPTKKTVTVKNVDILQFKDGKLVHGWGYSNGADFMQQIGMAPKPPTAAAGAAKPGDTAKPGATPAPGSTPGSAPAAKPGDTKPATPATPAKPADMKK